VERQAPRGCYRKCKLYPAAKSFLVGVLYVGSGVLSVEFRLVDSSVAGEERLSHPTQWSKLYLRSLLTVFITGFPQPQLGHRAQDHQCSQEQGGGRSKRQLDGYQDDTTSL
jgi:hypothetical protein